MSTALAPIRILSAGRTLRTDGEAPNQDRFLIGHLGKSMLVSESNSSLGNNARLFGLSQGHFLVVADGFGAPPAGASAAEAALETLATQLVNHVPWFFGLDVDFGERLSREFGRAVARCHRSVRALEQSGHAANDAGATLTAAYFLWPRMYLTHLGDCRCYLVRGGKYRCLTDGGAKGSRENALGADVEEPTTEVLRVTLEVGDRIVLCTPGLSRAVDDAAIVRAVDGSDSVDEASEALIRAARESAADVDDATVIVARIDAVDTETPRQPLPDAS